MILEIALIAFTLFFAVVIHEYAHGWMANQLGDPTAKAAGRLTLNPLKHIDPVGTILLPGILLLMRHFGYPVFIFGWAKPVPVNFRGLRNPKRDMMLVGMAGPFVNIVMAVVFSFFVRVALFPSLSGIFTIAVFINLLLAIFNMIPVPPLDGSRLVMGLLPNRLLFYYARLERFGIIIVIGLLYLGIFESVVLPLIYAVGAMLGVDFHAIH